MPISFGGTIMEVVAPCIWPVERVGTLRIIDPYAESREQFFTAITQAVELVERNDPLRYARIQREVAKVINMPVFTVAAYSRTTKTCRIDIRCIPLQEDWESSVVLLACCLIHEATHGHLDSRQIPYVDRTYHQIERLCFKEEARFAQKLGLDISSSLDRLMAESRRPTFREMLRVAYDDLRQQLKDPPTH